MMETETLYFNGPIVTMDSSNIDHMPEAVLTEKGRILALGSYEDLVKLAVGPILFDLQGNTLLPAFIDAHSHFSGCANSFLQVALEECYSFEEMTHAIREFMAKNQITPGQWIFAKGYDHNFLREHKHPDKDLLDACCPNNPLILQHASGHVGVCNSLALKELGITAETLPPEGGKIGTVQGELTGYLEENAFIQSLKKAPMADTQKLLQAYTKAQEQYASFGITTIQEGLMISELIPLYQYLLEQKLLTLDVVAYADPKDSQTIASAFPQSLKTYHQHFKLGGYKIFLDGSPQGRTAWMRTPYQGGEPEYTGYGTMQRDEVIAVLQRAVSNQEQILVHCNGDAAAEQFIDCAACVPHLGELRPVMVHAQLLGIDQLERVKALGILPSFFVAHVYHWGDIHIENFGMERASKISPAGSSLNKDMRFTFHQDAPVIPPNMIETLWCAVNRVTKAGVSLGQDERISVYEALKAITIHAAYQYFEEDQKGSLAPGKLADFVILDQNPLVTPIEELRSIQVVQTIKRDKVLYENPVLGN